MNKYQVEKKIGKGSYGNVYICRAKADGKRYVLKKIPLDNMSAKEKHSTRQEVALLQSLQHPNIVGYKDSFMTSNDKELCIVMTYCEGGDLSSKIKEYKYKKIPEKVVMKWFAQLLLAVEFLHSRKVLHRDLKSQNIFLMKDGTVKLGDFGIARVFERTLDMAKTSIGTPLYMSPEVCNNRPYNYKSDIWSLGCILYELCARKPPFNARDLRGLFVKIMRGVYSPIPYTYSTKLQDLVRKTLYTNPHRRPSISQILKSAYVKKSAQSYIRELLVNSNPIQNADPNRLRHTMIMERRETSNIKIQATELGYDLDAIMRSSSVDSSQDSKSSHKKGSDTDSEQHSVHSSRHHHRRHSNISNAPSVSSAAPSVAPSHEQQKKDLVLNKRKIPLRDVKRAVAKLNKMEEEQQRVKEALEKLKKEKLDRQTRLARANEIRRAALSQKKRHQDDAILEKQRRKQKAAEERRRRIKQGLAAPPKYGSRAHKGPSSHRSRSSEKSPPKSHAAPSSHGDQPNKRPDEEYKKRYNRIRESKQELDQYVEKRKQMEKQIQNIEQELHDMASKGVAGRQGRPAAPSNDDYREHIKKMAQPDHIPAPSVSRVPSHTKDELSGLSHRDRILKMKEMKKRAEEAEKHNMLQQARREYHSNRVRAQRMQYNQYHGSSPPKRRPSEQQGDDKSSLQSMLPQQDRYQQNEQFLHEQDKRRPSRSVSPETAHNKNNDNSDNDSEENELIEEMEKAYTTQKKHLTELRKTLTQAYGKSIHDLRALAESKDDEPDSEDDDDLESDDESEESDDEQYEEMHELVQPGRLSDRISHLRQLCIKYLGESNFKKLYRAMRDGTLPNDDRVREEQIAGLIGHKKLEYVSLIDELLFTEDSLA
mmetsp:Transcript_9901/g.36909  ORF Transcript_9901/g.36909 Transcript_9901/m.36909 type:complete len:876 (-) Transcript_9901:98-2725(-)|eukprot:CAMPEP_0117441798 /NCGR_PEP_ID=MMETSP0759-20121206/3819_1 /TAXON_ID=63605 /ORGANISM="Percolomonas cosmopolitus, Strain WS" /LENGTH=875 /DNA_ID=CAMNT_0005233661 /DNA_START=447 /DNA_END=3074 /DNA_ORIENTATION=+